jgi:lipid-A-disaccharide synthase
MIPIDFGFVNIRLARMARQAGWKVLYFIPPGSWRRDRAGKDLPQVADVLVTPFPWSEKLLRQMGAEAHFWGHPLLDLIPPRSETLPRRGVALLPGSRTHEVRANLEVMARATAGKGLELSLGLARALDEAETLSIWKSWGGDPVRVRRDVQALLQESDAALVCSGTATLEAALCFCPTCVLYTGSWLMKVEYALVKHKIKYVSLPNILLDEPLLPECLTVKHHHEVVWEQLRPVLESEETRERQREGFRRLRAITGEPGCLDKTAHLAAKMLGLASGT